MSTPQIIVATEQQLEEIFMRVLEKDRAKANQREKEKGPAEIIDATTLCTRLGISRPTLRKWVLKGKVAEIKTPTGSVRYNYTTIVFELEKDKK